MKQQKQWYKTRIIEILTTKDHIIEAVRIFKYLGTAINNTNNETEETKARILAANTAFSSLQTVFRFKQIHRNYKTRLYKTLVKPVLLRKGNLDPNTNGRTNIMYFDVCWTVHHCDN